MSTKQSVFQVSIWQWDCLHSQDSQLQKSPNCLKWDLLQVVKCSACCQDWQKSTGGKLNPKLLSVDSQFIPGHCFVRIPPTGLHTVQISLLRTLDRCCCVRSTLFHPVHANDNNLWHRDHHLRTATTTMHTQHKCSPWTENRSWGMQLCTGCWRQHGRISLPLVCTVQQSRLSTLDKCCSLSGLVFHALSIPGS